MLNLSRRVSSSTSTVACLLALMAAAAHAAPVSIEYELSALASPGRYEYRYTITNLSLTTPLDWFAIDFDTSLYDESSLSITSVGAGSWSEQILASVPVFGVPAQYDAYTTPGGALGIGDSATGFSVQFDWLGTGTPGSQAFTIYDSSTFGVLSVGVTTTTAVPEPSTIALAVIGLCGMGVVAWRRNRRTPVTSAEPRNG